MQFEIKRPAPRVYKHPTIEEGIPIATNHEFPNEWLVYPETGVDHLSMTSFLNGGPAPRGEEYSLLQLGCQSGGNVLAIAFYNPAATFVGLDPSPRLIAVAQARARKLGLGNVRFFVGGPEALGEAIGPDERFDFVLVQEVFTWAGAAERQALLTACAERLEPDGLAAIDYDVVPGWNIRESTLMQLISTLRRNDDVDAHIARLRARASDTVKGLGPIDRASFSDLYRADLDFIGEVLPSQIYRYYLHPGPAPIKLQDFVPMAKACGLRQIADASFGRPWSIVPRATPVHIPPTTISGVPFEQMHDNFSLRRNRCSVLCRSDWSGAPGSHAGLAGSSFTSWARVAESSDARSVFVLDGGDELSTVDPTIATLVKTLAESWPRGLGLDALVEAAALPSRDPALLGTLVQLHVAGFVEIRWREAAVDTPSDAPLHALARVELEHGCRLTTPWHTVLRLDAAQRDAVLAGQNGSGSETLPASTEISRVTAALLNRHGLLERAAP